MIKKRLSQRPTQQKPAQSQQELEERRFQDPERERLEWLQRRRLHTAVFADVWFDAKWAKLGGKYVGDRAQKEAHDRAQEVAAIAKKLRWSDERLASFQQAIVDYRKNGTLEAYLRVRQQFPEVEIQVGKLAAMDAVFVLEDEFKKQGIDQYLVASCLEADEPSIDALCLQLLEKIVEREKISKDEPGHIQKHCAAISDAMVNYLIVTILEACDWNDLEVRVPASLVVLIRHQLTSAKPDLHTTYRARDKLHNTAIFVAQRLKPNEKLSINKLASMVNIPRSSAARLLKDKEFQSWLKTAQGWAAEGLFKNVGK